MPLKYHVIENIMESGAGAIFHNIFKSIHFCPESGIYLLYAAYIQIRSRLLLS